MAAIALIATLESAWAEFPAITQRAEIQPPGTLVLDLGLGYRSEPKDFGLPEHDARWDLAKTRVAVGLGDLVEVQATGILISFVENAAGTKDELADWTLGTKIRLFEEQDRLPAMALLWEVKIPLASDEDGIGTDETDFFFHFLASKHFGERSRLDFNLGGGILGDPKKNTEQDDVLMISAAWSGYLSDKDVFGGELLFRSGFKKNDSPIALRGIYRRILGRWSISAALSVGLNDDADEFGLDLFFRRQFQLWSSSGTETGLLR